MSTKLAEKFLKGVPLTGHLQNRQRHLLKDNVPQSAKAVLSRAGELMDHCAALAAVFPSIELARSFNLCCPDFGEISTRHARKAHRGGDVVFDPATGEIETKIDPTLAKTFIIR